MLEYRKKPIVIEAIQFLGFNPETGNAMFSDRPEWLINEFGKNILFFDEPNTLTIVTLEGNMRAGEYDYIVKGINGEFYPCKADIFEKTYEATDDVASMVSKEMAQLARVRAYRNN